MVATAVAGQGQLELGALPQRLGGGGPFGFGQYLVVLASGPASSARAGPRQVASACPSTRAASSGAVSRAWARSASTRRMSSSLSRTSSR
jgi:hypothetical protein